MARKVSNGNVIRCLIELRFGNSAEGRGRLQRDLKRFRALSDAQITDTAIDNWFRSGGSGPHRTRSLIFLHAYFRENVKRESSKTRDYHDLFAAVEDFLRPPVHSADGTSPSAVGGATLGSGTGIAGAVGRWNEGDQEILLQFRALAGTYQIIRPHAAAQDYFVLEAMAVEMSEEHGSANLQMYSHNQRAREFLYQGEFYASFRYCFSLVRRRHENNPSRFAIRCVSLNVGAQREPEGYFPYPCLSGLLVRGVAGYDGPRRAISVPFVAFKAPDDPQQFKLASFPVLKADLRRLSDGSSVVVGETSSPTALFGFCQQIFSMLSTELSTGLVLRTVKPEAIQSVIMSLAQRGEQTPFAVWKGAVAAFAAEGG